MSEIGNFTIDVNKLYNKFSGDREEINWINKLYKVYGDYNNKLLVIGTHRHIIAYRLLQISTTQTQYVYETNHIELDNNICTSRSIAFKLGNS